MKKINNISQPLTFDNSWSDDKKRKNYLLNFIGSFLIVFILAIILIRSFGEIFFGFSNGKESFILLFLILSVLLFMVFLIKKGFANLISFSLIALLLFSSLKGSVTWGIDLYTVNIMYPFIILLSAILISSKFSFVIFTFISFSLSLIFFLQNSGSISSYSEWRSLPPSFLNLLTIVVVYFLMTSLAWLSSREVEKSLQKARSLAGKLKLQNENLELLVEDRTKKLKLLQLKQLTQVAPLLDLGKLSAGLIHDIRQPLAVLSVILQEAEQNKNTLQDLDQAFLAINKIDDLSKISACKLFTESENEIFSLNSEIKKLINLFEYKARSKEIHIIFLESKHFDLHADRKKLSQILANIILNAIESYDDIAKPDKNIFIKLIKKPRNLLIKIKDYGLGISPENLPQIFEANFSSKKIGDSLGLGLYVSQEAMNAVFNSKIRVESEVGVGSTFTLFIKNRFILDANQKST